MNQNVMLRKSLFLSFLLLFSFSVLAEEVDNECFEALQRIAHFKNEYRHGDAEVVLQQFQRLQNDPGVVQVLPKSLVIDLVSNPENTLYTRYLKEVLERFETQANLELPTSEARLKDAFRQLLIDRTPEKTIENRLEALNLKSEAGLLAALGANSRAEMLDLLHGGNALQPTPESLIGKYLAETGASTLVRGFTRVPNEYNSPNKGPERLVVAVSEATFPQFRKYFMRPELFSVHGHAYISNDGKLTSYTHQGVEFRLPSPGYSLPQVVLKTSEAQRFQNHLTLLIAELEAGKGYSFNNRAIHPWAIDNYIPSAKNCYLNCTHWIGNIPIGDKQVNAYDFPTNNNMPSNHPLQPFDLKEGLINRVWKAQGHEQLSSVLGIQEHNVVGNMASPGYVVHTLLGETPVESVPVVFYIVNDVKQPIAPDYKYTVEDAR